MQTTRFERQPSRSGSGVNDGTLSIVHCFEDASAIPAMSFGNMLCANSACVARSPTKR